MSLITTKLKISLVFIIPLITVLVLTELLFRSKSYDSFTQTKSKIWRHRGGEPENTIEAVKKSIIEQNFDGVEIDLFYDLEKDAFVVNHDKPLAKVVYPVLSEFLSALAPYQVSFWLDLKNLEESNVESVKKRLSYLKSKYSNFNHFVVESRNYLPLRSLSKSDVKTIYWINPHAKSRVRYFRNIVNKWKIILADFVGVSVYYTSYENSISKDNLLKNIPLYLFTINEEKKIKELITKDNIKVILSKEVEAI